MWSWAAAGCALLLSAGASVAQQPAPANPAKSTAAATASAPAGASAKPRLEEVEAKVHEEWEAFKNKDRQKYADLLTDDYEGVEDDTEGTRNKWHMLRELDHSVVTDYKLARFHVTPLGPETALATYEVFMKFPSYATRKYNKVYISEVWATVDGTWKVAHSQETKMKQ
jgi:hypothetical protein